MPIADRLTREAVEAHLRDQATWPEITDCDRLDDALDELTRHGIVCRQNFTCCGNCGVTEIGDEMEVERRAGRNVRGYAFYHMQDTESAAEGCGLYLHYGAVAQGETAALGVGREIIAALTAHGLATRWNGRSDTRLKVELDWKRRLPQDVKAASRPGRPPSCCSNLPESSRSLPAMDLQLESGRQIRGVTEADIRASLEGEDFAILAADELTYMQCAKTFRAASWVRPRVPGGLARRALLGGGSSHFPRTCDVRVHQVPAWRFVLARRFPVGEAGSVVLIMAGAPGGSDR